MIFWISSEALGNSRKGLGWTFSRCLLVCLKGIVPLAFYSVSHPEWDVSLGSIKEWQGSGPFPVFRLQRTLWASDTASVLFQEPRSYFNRSLFIKMPFGMLFHIAPWFFFPTVSLSVFLWLFLLWSEYASRLHSPGREMKDSPCDRGSSETPRSSGRTTLKWDQASKV